MEGCHFVSNSSRYCIKTLPGTNLGGINLGVVEEHGKVNQINGLCAILQNLDIDRAVQVLDLVAGEDEALVSPGLVADVIGLGRDGGDNAKVVTGSLHCPPKIRVCVFGDGGYVSVGIDNCHGQKLVGDKPMTALEDAMAAAQAGTEYAGAFTDSSDYIMIESLVHLHGVVIGHVKPLLVLTRLLPRGPERICDLLRQGTTSNSDLTSILGYLNQVQFLEPNLNTMFHLALGNDGSTAAVHGQVRKLFAVGEFYLYNSKMSESATCSLS